MYTYKKILEANGNINSNLILRSDNTYIPFDEANTDYQEYLKWIAEGNEPIPADQ
jgi:hypothetical protein